MKQCAIIVLGDHYKISVQSEILLSQKYECTHYVNITKETEDEFNSCIDTKKIKVKTFKNNFSLFKQLKSDQKNYEIIYFQDFIDHIRNSQKLSIFLFLCSNKIKTVVAIRNSFSYMPNKIFLYWRSYKSSSKSNIRIFIKKILQFSRVCINYFLIKYINSYVFESQTQLNYFLNNFPKKNNKSYGIVYDKYTKSFNSKKTYKFDKSKKVMIGLLGGINLQRRNYESLISSLKLLKEDIRNNLMLVILGNTKNFYSEEILKKIEKYVELKRINTFLTEEEFETYGKQCSFLLSPLNEEKPYGTYTGTGGFGDLIFLKRKLIMPKKVDPFREFKDFCLYYECTNELAIILKDISTNKIEGELTSQNLRKFHKIEVLKELEIKNIF